jgi:hypothetical protein
MGINPWGILIPGRISTKNRVTNKGPVRKRPGRKPGLVKTKTIKKRKMEIYFPTEGAKEALLRAAVMKGMSASKYILSCLEEVQTGPLAAPASKDLIKAQEEIRALKTEKEALERQNEQLLALAGKNALEISLLRTKETPVRETPVEDGIHKLNKHLIEALRSGKEVNGADLYDLLGLNPKDKEAVSRVWKDLETLTSHGLIEATMEGWRWLGK